MSWQALEEALLAEVELLGRAVELGERKRDTLTANDIIALEAMFSEEDRLSAELKAREFQLTGVIAQLGSRLGVTGLEAIIRSPVCPRPQTLWRLFERMVVRMATLKQINEQNRMLIEEALHYIDYSLKVIAGSTDDPVYDADGKSRFSQTPRRIDRRM